jgi:hypothetical protein
VPGHAWGDLCHHPTVQWLCQWKENINNQVKYMQLAAQSSFKGKSDWSKYNKATKLCGNIDKIRADYKKNLKSKSLEVRQIATAIMWVIDQLALCVGGEKDTTHFKSIVFFLILNRNFPLDRKITFVCVICMIADHFSQDLSLVARSLILTPTPWRPLSSPSLPLSLDITNTALLQ